MLIGYARVSTADQNLSLQLAALTAAGRFFHVMNAPAEAPAYSRQGDSPVVWNLDRIGRSMKGHVNLATNLKARQVDLRLLTGDIDTKTAAGRFFLHVMNALDAARRAGRVGGRKRVMTPAKLEAAKKLLDAGTSPKDVASSLGVSGGYPIPARSGRRAHTVRNSILEHNALNIPSLE
jgi:DNA invertase Pin-like site-specific DNA recombinase